MTTYTTSGEVALQIGRTLHGAVFANYHQGYMDGIATQKVRTREIQSAFDFVIQHAQNSKDVAEQIGRALHATLDTRHHIS